MPFFNLWMNGDYNLMGAFHLKPYQWSHVLSLGISPPEMLPLLHGYLRSLQVNIKIILYVIWVINLEIRFISQVSNKHTITWVAILIT